MTTNRMGLEQEGRLSDERLNELIDEILGFQSRIEASDSNNWHKKTSEVLSVLRELLERRGGSKNPVHQMRLLDGSPDEFTWVEVTETKFNTQLKDESQWDKRILYAAPPIPVVTVPVPDKMIIPDVMRLTMGSCAVGAAVVIAKVEGWNACRAEMLKSVTNEP